GRGSRVGSPSARFATPARPPQPLPLPAASALQTLSPGAALIPTPRPGPPAFQERPPMRSAFFILAPSSIACSGYQAGRLRRPLAPRAQGRPDPAADRLLLPARRVRPPAGADLEAVALVPREHVEVGVEHLLPGGLAVGVEEVHALAAQAAG